MISDRLYRSLRRAPFIQIQLRRVIRRLPHRSRPVRHFGQWLEVDPSELHGFYLYYEHEYDDFVFEFLTRQIPRYECAVDVGANIGIYTVFLAARLGHVDAFEPEPALLPRLRRNLRMNNLDNVRVHETCVAQASTTVGFLRAGRTNQGIGGIVPEGDPGAVKMPAISLDDFFGGSVRDPVLVKMDIEGAEWPALQGFHDSLSHRTARVDMLLEVHPSQIEMLGGSILQLRELLERLGFEICGLAPEGLTSDIEAEKCRFWWISDRNH